ncbi:N-methyl-L-tryptophan oxidase [Kushneria marisflavi]|uniref:N-methyltryptophan oxidase n=1 Tax=Kushneria marisflavi TaxID=157779 RepID=A0A240UL74_9GAMM|nr:N-methyl-L-tryptophan oxidase [Kushneria marisflavi]ART62257.1 N-methyltryptophan oxidase [Kushneria marisflavi]RKD87351.1 N-methyl-L-tryptophan oxidase [Kushneria marisflavi]
MTALSTDYPGTDYLIIGAGSMGMATADWLARHSDASVQLLDAFSPPHEHGAHHGETRLLRQAYGEGSSYVPLARRALELWKQLEEESGETLFLPTGVINVGPPGTPFIQQVEASARQHGLALDSLSGDQVSRRWPGWALDQSMHGCFEPEAGVLFVERIIACWRERVARSPRMSLATGAQVIRLEAGEQGGWVAVCADGRRFGAERVLLSSGQHIAPLMAELDVELPLNRVRKTFAWYRCDARFEAEQFPGFSLTTPSGAVYYGFPDIEGAGFKMGRHDSGQLLEPDEAMVAFGEHEDDVSEFQQVVDRYFPGIQTLRHGAVCQYIRTPDEHFLIDEPLPGLIVAGGFSGHGFKFASALGEALGLWLDQQRRLPELALFGLARFSSSQDSAS